MNRNIEVGCLVMVVNVMWDRSHLGKCYEVKSMITPKSELIGEPVWELGMPFPNRAAESWLIRIDNHDTSADETERNMELTQ